MIEQSNQDMSQHHNKSSPFEIAMENVDDNQGGDPMETSQHSAGGFGAQGHPSDLHQRAFIFDHQSESTEQRPSDAHARFKMGSDPPRVSHADSLPFSLKDSQESISAVKNMSRYAEDQSATKHFINAHNGIHNITHEKNHDEYDISHRPLTKPPKLELKIKHQQDEDEVKGPLPAVMGSAGIHKENSLG